MSLILGKEYCRIDNNGRFKFPIALKRPLLSILQYSLPSINDIFIYYFSICKGTNNFPKKTIYFHCLLKTSIKFHFLPKTNKLQKGCKKISLYLSSLINNVLQMFVGLEKCPGIFWNKKSVWGRLLISFCGAIFFSLSLLYGKARGGILLIGSLWSTALCLCSQKLYAHFIYTLSSIVSR